ncbi:hypothetical protein WG922_05555 [Ramlibacter sp. AN1015]|uniref:hypothetical protein n=1 Tax=Ramlibacter sp. AN1015 TaxID=3133428 RepID=UPI0030C3CDF3
MSIEKISRWHLLFGLVFAIAGMVLGIVMATSKNHGQHVSHAHIMLLGFVVSAIYAVVYRLWLSASSVRMAIAQTALHQVGAAVLSVGLYLLYGGIASEAAVGPVLGAGSIAALLGVVLMLVQVLAAQPAKLGAATPAGSAP